MRAAYHEPCEGYEAEATKHEASLAERPASRPVGVVLCPRCQQQLHLKSHPVRSILSLVFALPVEDGWPPVASECLPFHADRDRYELLDPPLFVKDLSVGDVIQAKVDAVSQCVFEWRHVTKSAHSTVWLLRTRPSDSIDRVLAELRELGCNTVRFEQGGVYAIDVPASLQMTVVDDVLERLDRASVAVAFPSMRHEE